MESKTLTALVLGGTGEVGREVVQQLISHPRFAKVIIVGRRPIDDITSDKIDYRQVDFENLQKEQFEGADVAYCCLGTTRAKAGKEGFIKVDKEYVVNSAQILKTIGCQQFHLVTSQGSNKNSMFLYPKIKGEAEEAVTNLQFHRLSVYQPGLLLCDRKESRIFETGLQAIAKGFDWRNRLSVHTETVARAMITNTLCPPKEGTSSESYQVEIVNHADILKLGID